MKRMLIASAALSLLAGGAAMAQPAWQSINQRQANLEQRIDVGVRNGSLTRAEAERLRSDFRVLVAAETTYRRTGGGLDARERADLDRRFNELSQKIRAERNDGGWVGINQRQAQLDQRIDASLRAGRITRREADQLRADFRAIAAIEARYRASGGLDARERADLDQRFNALSARIRFEANDGNANWRPITINERQAKLNARIDAGVRSGQISTVEAVRLRTEFLALARLEDTYRATGGLTAWERQDLERRFDALAVRIRLERRDWWQF